MPRTKASKPQIKKTTRPRSSKSKGLTRLQGMKDWLFGDYKYFNLVLNKMAELAKIYGFEKLETPVMEDCNLFKTIYGKNSDVVNKELYHFDDKGGDKIALITNLLIGQARVYNEHAMLEAAQPVKMFSFGPVFARQHQDRKYKQVHQFDLSIFGEESPMADALLIAITHNFFKELQIDSQVQINSIGDNEALKKYVSALHKFYKERGRKTKLCPECKKNVLKDTAKLLNCKDPKCIESREEMPQIVDFLNDSCKDHFTKVLEYLDELGVDYNFNPSLIKDDNNCNRTIFEIWPLDNKNSLVQNKALAEGGRFDNLMEKISKERVPICSVSMSLEKVIARVREKNIAIKQEEDVVFLAQLGDQARLKALNIFEDLRKAGFNIRQSFTKDQLRLQLEEAKKVKSRLSLILGQKEVMDETILLRDMESGVQEIIPQKKIKDEIRKKLKN